MSSTSVLVYDFKLYRMVQFSCLTVLVCDYLLTLDDEIHHIWQAKWTKGRILFLLVRYLPLIDFIVDVFSTIIGLPSHTICKLDWLWVSYNTILIETILSIILILRLSALYQCQRRLRNMLFGILILTTLADVALISYTIPQLEAPAAYVAGWGTVCAPTHYRSFSWTNWVPPTLMESVLFAVATGKTAELVFAGARDAFASELLYVMLRDSLVSYGSILVLLAANVALFAAARQTFRGSIAGTLPAMESILGCRMLLNIYEAAESNVAWRCWNDELEDAVVVHTPSTEEPV